ncbi:Arabinanase/levansucrase/invertase [Sarocladium strictum]
MALTTRQQATFENPVLFQDLPDIDVFRVGSVYYYSTSTFAFSPGAPVLKSYDLVNWTPITHSVPDVADFGDEYNLNGDDDRAYVKGIWASSMRYRESDDKFYWMGCIQSTGKTFLYTSPGNGAAENDGENDDWDWTLEGTIDECFYDNGIFFDDDDTMYVTWGARQLRVTELSADGLSIVRTETVYNSGEDLYLEGAHLYKTHGYYWVCPTKVASGQYILRASEPFGPYEVREFWDNLDGPLPHAGYAHQGGMVDTPEGDWHYLAFLDAYPAGRIPVLAPIVWSDDDWPSIVLDDNGDWGVTYPMPVKTDKTVPGVERIDDFSGSTLHPEWEWNHSPDPDYFELASGGLVLKTANVVEDLFNARNTLTHRITGPRSLATWHLDISGMTEGDRAGAAIFRDESAYIGVHKDSNGTRIVFVDEINLDSDYKTISRGTVAETGPSVKCNKEVWFRVDADVTPAFGLAPVREAHFYFSLDGETWEQLGTFVLHNRWQWFTGFRFAAFNFATEELGGEVVVKSFEHSLA